MKRKTHEKRCLYWYKALVLILSVCLIGCQDDKIGSNGYDPSKPVVFSDFTPDHGSLRTQIHIYGDNFGTDPSKIHITIGGQYTTTIGCTNTEIYCIVPPKAFDGNIKIKIESADGKTSPIEYEFEKKFNYTLQPSVSTLVGSEDENGNSSDVDGNFEKARFGNPQWLLMDTFGIEMVKAVLYVESIWKQKKSQLFLLMAREDLGICNSCLSMQPETLFSYQMTMEAAVKTTVKLLTFCDLKNSEKPTPMFMTAQDITMFTAP